MRTAAILPVKRFTRAKQRLGASVGEEIRAGLARAMVADVLDALRRTPAIAQTIVVSGADSVVAAALERGALVAHDSREESQSAAVVLGIERALAEGFERVLCVPGDCPALDPGELDALLSGPAPAVVIVPDRHGTGTNGLLLTPPDAILPSFGPGSFARHRALAREAGASWEVRRPSSLLLDIDTGEDLAVLRERLGAERGGAAQRTRLVLGAAESGQVLPITTLA
jgi:2-phospho-L-lactate guanylyltransferase